ncbi:hypothetical protein D3C72_1677400 [compost metagenome]
MGDGQEGQEHIVLRRHHAAKNGLHVAHHIAVVQHHALGLAGSAARVDDGRQIFGLGLRGGGYSGNCRCLQPVLQANNADGARLICARSSCFDSGLARVIHHHTAQGWQRRAGGGNLLPGFEPVDEQQRSACVGQDEGDIARVVIRMQRHGHAALGEACLVNADGVHAVGEQGSDAGTAFELQVTDGA